MLILALILLIALAVTVVLLTICEHFLPGLFHGANGNDYKVFVAYFSLYLSIWTLYFASPRLSNHVPSVLSLRVFLRNNSKQWTLDNNSSDHEIGDKILEKAKTSTTAISMLVAASLVALSQARVGWDKLMETTCRMPINGLPADLCTWNKILFFGLSVSATLALVSFVISADALDSMFNQFESSSLDNRYRRYFYRSAINPRYVGLASLVTTIVFINALVNILLGSISVALIVSLGFRHWFVSPRIINEDHWENRSVLGILVKVLTFSSIPILVRLVSLYHLKP